MFDMKQEDFERLTAVCEKEGFEITRHWDTMNVVVKAKDPWDGVEYAKFIWDEKDDSFTKGKIYKLERVKLNRINIENDDNGFPNGWQKRLFIPSTESAYIEQLKKEAFERFGEIREGDRFEGGGSLGMIEKYYTKEWGYDKKEDLLTYFGRVIYQSGKWATRVKERVDGSYVKYHILWPNDDGATLGYRFSGFEDKDGSLPIEKLDYAGRFLASQLEEFFNK